MATLTIDGPGLFDPPAAESVADDAHARAVARPRERTLEALLVGVWDEVAAARPAACPVCAGTLAPRFGAGAQPIGAGCRDCGSRLG